MQLTPHPSHELITRAWRTRRRPTTWVGLGGMEDDDVIDWLRSRHHGGVVEMGRCS